MPKTLSERIQLRATNAKATRRAQNHAAFLAQRKQIVQSLADGWAILHIWDALRAEGKIETGYAAFCRRVKRMNLTYGPAITKGPAMASALAAAGTTQRSKSGLILDGFTYESTPDEKELL